MIPPIVRLSTICLLAVGWSVCPPARAQEFSAPNADDLLRSLAVVIGPRPMGSPAERRALAFATEKLLLYGCDTAFVMPMMKAASVNTASGVAVGIKKGRTGRIIVLGGHIDSAGPEIPGANDDASGSAVVLEAARALSRDELQSTIVFALFGGEERGARGSRAFVEHFDGIDSVVLMIQIDMANGSGTIILDPDAHGASAPPWLVRATVEEFTGLGYTGLDYPLHYFSWNYATEKGSGSDHVPFLQAGIPAIDFTTDVGDPIHTPQDSYANFDPAGLKRSGDLALRLVRRFDGGVPSRATARYWLCLVGALPVIVPLWGVWFFVAGSALFGFAVLLRMRKAHFSVAPAGADQAGKRRWSGVKLLLVSLVTVLPAWYSSNLIGVIKNDRYPWFAHPEHYIVLGLLASVFGILTGLRLAGGLQISRSPYVLFKRSFIALLAAVVLAAFAGVKIAVPFAVCLLFLSSSLVLSLRLPAALIALVAPVWMFRLVFSEAYTLIFRLAAPGIPGTATAEIMVNGLWIGALTLLVFSWLPGFVAVARRHGGSGRLLGAIRSRRFLVITAGLFGIYTTYLVLLPSYERPWYPDLTISRIADLTAGTDTLRIAGSEYLRGAEIRFDDTDTIIRDNSLVFLSTSVRRAGEPWLRVGRDIRAERSDSGMIYDVTVSLRMPVRPYTVTIRYESSSGTAPPVSTPLGSRRTGNGTSISWYSFPDSVLDAPVSFTVPNGDTLTEKIEVTFDTLNSPVEVQYRHANLFRRMTWREQRAYGSTGVTGESGRPGR